MEERRGVSSFNTDLTLIVDIFTEAGKPIFSPEGFHIEMQNKYIWRLSLK